MKGVRRHKSGAASFDPNPDDFVVTGRPWLADLTDHPELEFADYERRLVSLQGILQLTTGLPWQFRARPDRA